MERSIGTVKAWLAGPRGAWLWAGTAYVLTLLVLLPLMPAMPTTDLDGSWAYAMNVGVAERLRFGRDLVFTFGPLAAAYTHHYSPATDGLMLGVSLVLATAFFAGVAIHAVRGRSAWLLLVPVVLSQDVARDATFMLIPLLFLQALGSDLRSRWHLAIVLLLAVACGLLPLVKGSFTLPVVVCSALAVHAAWQKSMRLGLLLAAAASMAMTVAWLACGQSMGDLPSFFTAQLSIVSGYTEAMSTAGPESEILIYLGVAALLLWAVWVTCAAQKWRMSIATATVLFLCFKAGFVRHDAHAVIAASALLLLGGLVLLYRPSRATALACVMSLFGWSAIAGPYVTVDPGLMPSKVRQSIGTGLDGLEIRAMHPGWLLASFAAANANIARRYPLPITAGTADLYPTDLALLFANGARWSPRPVVQSYSAYTPSLAALNEEHLRVSGADRIYFNSQTIDSRLPSLEDGISWAALLSRYEPTSFAGDYAVLDRAVKARHVNIGSAVFDGEGAINIPFSVSGTDPLWAQIEISPTWLGRLAALLYKPPPLGLAIRTKDGKTSAYRLVPALAKSGFLLSPTISSARDFVALQSTRSRELLAGGFPTAFTVIGSPESSLFWRETFRLRVFSMNIEPTAAADRALDSTEPARSDMSARR